MQLAGEQLIPQTIQKVWEALNDTEILKACIPGCEELIKISDTEFKATMLSVIGPVKARFNGKLFISDVTAPTTYSLAFEGTGGMAGFVNGTARATLAAQQPGTKLDYTVDVKIGGKIAQIGSRLIDGVATRTSAEFFNRFKEAVGGAAAEPAIE
jgi:carbon monoxide dehydrogenase subunit G